MVKSLKLLCCGPCLLFQHTLFELLHRNGQPVGHDALISHKQFGGATSCKLQQGFPASITDQLQISSLYSCTGKLPICHCKVEINVLCSCETIHLSLPVSCLEYVDKSCSPWIVENRIWNNGCSWFRSEIFPNIYFNFLLNQLCAWMYMCEIRGTTTYMHILAEMELHETPLEDTNKNAFLWLFNLMIPKFLSKFFTTKMGTS